MTFVLKVIGWSALLSIAIKYGGPFLPISGTALTVSVAVWLPSLLMLFILGWRWQQFHKAGGN